MRRRAELAREISSLEATAGYRDIVGLQIELLRVEQFAERIWELRFNLTTYDAWYVACAEALTVPLATLDARLSQAPGSTPPAPSSFVTPRAPAVGGRSQDFARTRRSET